MRALGSSAGPNASPFALHGTFSSTDLDEVQSVAASAQHPLSVDPLGSVGPLRFQLHHHPLPRMVLTRAAFDYQGSWRVVAPPLERHYYLRIPLRGSDLVRHGTKTVRPAPGRVALLLSPGDPTAMQSVGGFEEISLEIDARAVDRAWQALTGEAPQGRIVFEPAVRLTGEPGHSIRRLLGFLAEEAYRPAPHEGREMGMARLEDALLLSLLQCQPHSHDRRLHRGPDGVRSALVHAAEAWMEAHRPDEITITTVAEAHNVTVRTLQRAFERYRMYSPRTFLRSLMLRRARTRLQRGDGDSVTRIALDVGFRHLGRFSGDYRQRYGESPSGTLRRARGRCHEPDQGTSERLDRPAKTRGASDPKGSPGSCGFCLGDIAGA